MIKILSIDVGCVKPGFVILETTGLEISIISYDLRFDKDVDRIAILNYFISKNIDMVIIEKQSQVVINVGVMNYIHGFFDAKGVPVVICNPFAHIRKDKSDKSRAAKKSFSVTVFNDILINSDLEDKVLKKSESDIADAINIGLLYLHNTTSKKNSSNTFIEEFKYKIVSFIRQDLETNMKPMKSVFKRNTELKSFVEKKLELKESDYTYLHNKENKVSNNIIVE